MMSGDIDAAQRLVKAWLSDAEKKYYSVIPAENFRLVYNVYTEATPRISLNEFRKRLQRNNIEITRKRPAQAAGNANATVLRGVVCNWDVDEYQLKHVIDQYFNQEDQMLLRVS